MIIRTFAAALGIALTQLPSVAAFKDTSPFIIVSSSSLPSDTGLKTHQLTAPAKTFEDAAASVISHCKSVAYVLVHQPGIHASDLSHLDQAPALRQQVLKDVQNSIVVEQGLGTVDVGRLEKVATDKCGAHKLEATPMGTFENIEVILKPKLIKISLPALPTDMPNRETALAENDAFLSGILTMLTTGDYTLVYTSSPASDLDRVFPLIRGENAQHPDTGFESAELRRRDTPLLEDDDDKRNRTRSLGLLSKYVFVNEGVLYGLMGFILTITILSFAVGALSNIKVSYGAFEKEMGPAAKKKQQ